MGLVVTKIEDKQQPGTGTVKTKILLSKPKWEIIDINMDRSYRIYEPCHEKTSLCFLTRSNTNRAVQPQKMARGLKFRKVRDCNENKGADQLHSYRSKLLFSHIQKLFFS